MIQLNSNASALNTQHHLQFITSDVSKSIERLSTGYRINNAGDDAAGLQISENLRSQQRGIDKAIANVQDGINMLNTLDSAHAQITEHMQRYRELSVQGANATNSSQSYQALEAEMENIITSIFAISSSANFNGETIFVNGTNSYTIQVGANDSSAENTLELNVAITSGGNLLQFEEETSASGDTIDSEYDLLSVSDAQELIRISDEYLNDLNERRGVIGALTNRLEGISQELMVQRENIAATESRIRNADIAAESAALTRNQVRQNAAASMLTQASRQNSQVALSLLQ